MHEITISVTQAVRNFAECVNRAHCRNQAFLLMRNGVAVARLVPVSRPACFGRDLLAALARTGLTPREARASHRDLRAAKKSLRPPRDKWR